MFNESDSPNWEMKQSIKLGKTLSFTKIHGVESFGSIEGNESDTIRKNISFNEVISSGHRWEIPTIGDWEYEAVMRREG